ncbi:MAG TPA: helix-turn-helix transcriptional regulator [Candidatus Woesebacteria bacterium]|nr:helix-turn-helix transcriptional regulator [Candidatus Woesebacteria bacterium]
MKKIRPQTEPLNNLVADFTKEDWQEVEKEKKYYNLVVQLRELRQKVGMTQQQLADKAALPRATIVRVESGRRNATLETLMSMAGAMGRDLVVGLR